MKPVSGKKKEPTFEQAMARLDEIVSALDGGMVSLDDSLALFSEGAELIAFCNKSLEGAKLTLEQLFPEQDNKDHNGKSSETEE